MPALGSATLGESAPEMTEEKYPVWLRVTVIILSAALVWTVIGFVIWNLVMLMF